MSEYFNLAHNQEMNFLISQLVSFFICSTIICYTYYVIGTVLNHVTQQLKNIYSPYPQRVYRMVDKNRFRDEQL